MAKSKPKRGYSKKKRRGADAGAKKKGGVISGMRGGFKSVAGAVTGLDEDAAKAKKKSSAILSTIVTLVIVALVAVFLMYR